MTKPKLEVALVDLVLDNGEIVRIECPGAFEDELHQTIEDRMKRRDWWSPGQWDGCTATFIGLNLSAVNMARVVGKL